MFVLETLLMPMLEEASLITSLAEWILMGLITPELGGYRRMDPWPGCHRVCMSEIHIVSLKDFFLETGLRLAAFSGLDGWD